MKAGFYPRLAFDGIRKNKRLYLPYIVTCTAMAAVYYIILYLSDIRGENTKAFMQMGGWVIAVFSVIFLFYTNSFLMRRRKKEFGLYHILGMGKRNISFILLWETLMIYAVSLAFGLLMGIALSKMAELALAFAVKDEVTYQVSVSVDAVVMAVALFGAIFLLIFLNAIRQINFSNTISLLRSESVGEKPPKGNWFLGIAGVLLLAGGYILSLTIENPLSAVMSFFAAVVLVVLGTYLIMIAGSVLFCKILQKNKKYYYQARHFVSVSSMVYRMKRNGAGLASICILATMTLVTISSTVSMYAGSEDSVRAQYPGEINLVLQYDSFSEENNAEMKRLPSEVGLVAEELHCKPSNILDYRCAAVAGQIQGDRVETDAAAVDDFSRYTYSDAAYFSFIPLEDYNRMMGTSYQLNQDEALLYSTQYDYRESSISFQGGNTLKIKQHIDKIFLPQKSLETVLPAICLIVPDVDYAVQGINEHALTDGGRMVSFYRYYQFDTGLDTSAQITLCDKLSTVLASEESYQTHRFTSVSIESREAGKENSYQLYGSLLYLGIVLSFVFLMAAVLIIYYKQISEGYEDQARFEIMQKVGMTKREIRKSINSQLLTVFFLPLIGAGLHLAFAFPGINKLLMLFQLNNISLFMISSCVCFAVFALFYALVYKITSNAYYNIVSEAKKE